MKKLLLLLTFACITAQFNTNCMKRKDLDSISKIRSDLIKSLNLLEKIETIRSIEKSVQDLDKFLKESKDKFEEIENINLMTFMTLLSENDRKAAQNQKEKLLAKLTSEYAALLNELGNRLMTRSGVPSSLIIFSAPTTRDIKRVIQATKKKLKSLKDDIVGEILPQASKFVENIDKNINGRNSINKMIERLEDLRRYDGFGQTTLSKFRFWNRSFNLAIPELVENAPFFLLSNEGEVFIKNMIPELKNAKEQLQGKNNNERELTDVDRMIKIYQNFLECDSLGATIAGIFIHSWSKQFCIKVPKLIVERLYPYSLLSNEGEEFIGKIIPELEKVKEKFDVLKKQVNGFIKKYTIPKFKSFKDLRIITTDDE